MSWTRRRLQVRGCKIGAKTEGAVKNRPDCRNPQHMSHAGLPRLGAMAVLPGQAAGRAPLSCLGNVIFSPTWHPFCKAISGRQPGSPDHEGKHH
jgi:hypothetical protein